MVAPPGAGVVGGGATVVADVGVVVDVPVAGVVDAGADDVGEVVLSVVVLSVVVVDVVVSLSPSPPPHAATSVAAATAMIAAVVRVVSF